MFFELKVVMISGIHNPKDGSFIVIVVIVCGL